MPIHDWTRVDAGIFHHFHQRWIGATTRGGSGITCCSFPKIRAPVETCTIASATAADANHALAAIVELKTDVTMSV